MESQLKGDTLANVLSKACSLYFFILITFLGQAKAYRLLQDEEEEEENELPITSGVSREVEEEIVYPSAKINERFELIMMIGMITVFTTCCLYAIFNYCRRECRTKVDLEYHLGIALA
mmetsp:Transcript_11388/g.19207  ORF Transcript_11388/g.19207 Transcript_11388/m.19207 type:complete len:118 (+) Transcript_11388:1-354(+)